MTFASGRWAAKKRDAGGSHLHAQSADDVGNGVGIARRHHPVLKFVVNDPQKRKRSVALDFLLRSKLFATLFALSTGHRRFISPTNSSNGGACYVRSRAAGGTEVELQAGLVPARK